MNILHTSDWHIGKRLADRERLPEQREALQELVRICDEREVDLVLVAGDVFDTYMPSAEAEEVFFHAVKQLAGEHRAVVAISGNHDDGVRLAASAPLAAEEGIYLFGGAQEGAPTGGTRRVRAVASGEGYVVLEKGEERVYLNVLPYPNEARLREEKGEERYEDKLRRRIERGDSGFQGGMPHILLSHLFVVGGRVSESERDIDLGGARAVPVSLFQGFDYVALGHLHKPQKMGANVRYSGSLLQYSFDEQEKKQVNLIRTQKGSVVSVEEIGLTAGRRLVRLEEENAERAAALIAQYQSCFVELTLRLGAPLTSSETQMLRAANEGLVSLIVRTRAQEADTAVKRSALSPKELFTEYYRTVYGEAPADALTDRFLALLEENA